MGAARTKGCDNPVKIWPNMTTPYIPPDARVPAYLIQLPSRRRAEETIIDCFGPWFSVHITRGEIAMKEKRNAVLSQLIAVSDTLKYFALEAETGANVNQSQLTTIFSRTSCANPNHLLLYTRKCV